ncbi:MAG: 7TM-DISM domain-containing protein [Bacteroidia bacterium]|nr:7TM-DISM domain-containing protein [Methylotenera sp.]
MFIQLILMYLRQKKSTEFVIDFKNTSTIAQFRHRIYNSKNQLIADTQGGIENATLNPFFLRHGRDFSLENGHYKLITEIISPNYLAIPEPYIDDRMHYQQSIKFSNTLTLMCLGIFLGLSIYYATLASLRNRLAECMYACFILGNFLYNSATLLVLADVFAVHSLYWATMPILFSNVAYVIFVMALLEIKVETKKRLYWAGITIFSAMCTLIGFAVVFPNWALELSLYGVGMFLSFGLVAAITESIRRNPTSRRYLVAISLFFILGLVTISLSKIDNQYTFYIEHMGLVSVAIEVVLLALVLSFQFSQLVRDKESALYQPVNGSSVFSV